MEMVNPRDSIDRWLDIQLKFLKKNGLGQSAWGQEKTSPAWPLQPVQILPYFDQFLAADIYKKIADFRKNNFDIAIVGSLFNTPLILKNFILNFATFGLKRAHANGLLKTDTHDRISYFHYLFDVLNHMLVSETFSSDRQAIYRTQHIEAIDWSAALAVTNDANGQALKNFRAALEQYIQAIYYDAFSFMGGNIHGPYRLRFHSFKYKPCVLGTCFFSLRPVEIWPEAGAAPFSQVDIVDNFVNFNLKMTFWDRLVSDKHLERNHRLFQVAVDGRVITDINKIKAWTDQLLLITEKQKAYVNRLTPLDQVKKAAIMNWLALKRFYDQLGLEWFPAKAVMDFIDQAGDTWIKKYAQSPKMSVKDVRRLLDPRNNEL